MTKQYIGETLTAVRETLWPLPCQTGGVFPVNALRSHLTLASLVRRRDEGAPHSVSPESSWAEGRREEILILMSQANDLWSIFRLEPYDWGGSGPFSWMWNETVVSPTPAAPTAMLTSVQSPPLRPGKLFFPHNSMCNNPSQPPLLLILIPGALYKQMPQHDWIVCKRDNLHHLLTKRLFSINQSKHLGDLND